MPKCVECNRKFDLMDEVDAEEWYYGHDCEPQDEDDEKTYSIVRHHFNKDNEVIDTGLSLEEAQEHCNREDTHGDGWFDGYTEE